MHKVFKEYVRYETQRLIPDYEGYAKDSEDPTIDILQGVAK